MSGVAAIRAAAATLILAACAAPTQALQPPADWIIVPGVRVGAITRAASEVDLVRTYGLGNVRTQNVDIGEGIRERATVVFPDDPTKTVAVIWKDLQNNQMPERIQITGSRSLWRTAQGITLGTSLKGLERLNGRSFAITGFGWDYGGTIVAWLQGRLERQFTSGGRIILRLRPPSGAARRAVAATSGDRVFRSSQQQMQQINPQVYQIIVEFR